MNKKEYEERMTKLERELKELKEAEIVESSFLILIHMTMIQEFQY